MVSSLHKKIISSKQGKRAALQSEVRFSFICLYGRPGKVELEEKENYIKRLKSPQFYNQVGEQVSLLHLEAERGAERNFKKLFDPNGHIAYLGSDTVTDIATIAQGRDLGTPLHDAVHSQKDHSKIIKTLLNPATIKALGKHNVVKILGARCKRFYTPLHLEALYKTPIILKELLDPVIIKELGEDTVYDLLLAEVTGPNLLRTEGKTFFHLAIRDGCNDAFPLLLDPSTIDALGVERVNSILTMQYDTRSPKTLFHTAVDQGNVDLRFKLQEPGVIQALGRERVDVLVSMTD